MTISDVFMIIAVLVAPFFAVFVQKKIETWKSQRDTKLWIFKTLMATRGSTLSPNHVQALNMIDLEFSDRDKKEKEVKRIWKEYLDNLAPLPKDPDAQKAALPAWSEKNTEYLAELLQAMGVCFGYDFDKVHIKRSIYSPEGYAKDEFEQRALRFFALEVLSGRKPLSIQTSIIPSDEEAAAFGRKLQQGLADYIDGKKDLTVRIKKDNAEQTD
jgi:hypothetical protein